MNKNEAKTVKEKNVVRVRIPLCLCKNFPHSWPLNGQFTDGKLLYNVSKPLGIIPKNGYEPEGYMQNYIFKEAYLRVYVFNNIEYEGCEENKMFNTIWDFLDSLTTEEINSLSYNEIKELFLNYIDVEKLSKNKEKEYMCAIAE